MSQNALLGHNKMADEFLVIKTTDERKEENVRLQKSPVPFVKEKTTTPTISPRPQTEEPEESNAALRKSPLVSTLHVETSIKDRQETEEADNDSVPGLTILTPIQTPSPALSASYFYRSDAKEQPKRQSLIDLPSMASSMVCGQNRRPSVLDQYDAKVKQSNSRLRGLFIQSSPASSMRRYGSTSAVLDLTDHAAPPTGFGSKLSLGSRLPPPLIRTSLGGSGVSLTEEEQEKDQKKWNDDTRRSSLFSSADSWRQKKGAESKKTEEPYKPKPEPRTRKLISAPETKPSASQNGFHKTHNGVSGKDTTRDSDEPTSPRSSVSSATSPSLWKKPTQPSRSSFLEPSPKPTPPSRKVAHEGSSEHLPQHRHSLFINNSSSSQDQDQVDATKEALACSRAKRASVAQSKFEEKFQKFERASIDASSLSPSASIKKTQLNPSNPNASVLSKKTMFENMAASFTSGTTSPLQSPSINHNQAKPPVPVHRPEITLAPAPVPVAVPKEAPEKPIRIEEQQQPPKTVEKSWIGKSIVTTDEASGKHESSVWHSEEQISVVTSVITETVDSSKTVKVSVYETTEESTFRKETKSVQNGETVDQLSHILDSKPKAVSPNGGRSESSAANGDDKLDSYDLSSIVLKRAYEDEGSVGIILMANAASDMPEIVVS